VVKKKAILKKTNSKGQVVKSKSHPTYFSMIKKCLKEHKERKGTSRQAIEKYILTNYGLVSKPALRRALKKGLEDGKLVSKSQGRYNLGASEKKREDKKKAKRKSKAKKDKKNDKKEKKKAKKSDKKEKKDKKSDKEKTSKKSAKTKGSPKKVTRKAVPKKAAPKTTTAATSTRGVAKPKSTVPTVSSTASTPVATASSGDLVWVWQYYDSGFKNYDPTASDMVEGVYQEYLRSPYTCDVRSVQSGQWQYEIDFRIMTQRNIQHESHTTRRIRRIQIPLLEKANKHKNYGGDEKYEHRSEKIMTK